MTLVSFTLSEQHAFGSQLSWRLKDSEIRFRGSGEYEKLVLRRIPASPGQVADFLAALDLIEVWNWRSDYAPEDVARSVLDGSGWSFIASCEGRQCRCGGVNAYPSFADVSRTTTDRGRYALLVAAMYDCFCIDGYINQAQRFAEREVRDCEGPGTARGSQ